MGGVAGDGEIGECESAGEGSCVQPGVSRERYIRPTDQVIVFLDDSKYERIDSKTKERTVRERKSGEVIRHDKGEDAPVLKNLGTKPYRALVIELKK